MGVGETLQELEATIKLCRSQIPKSLRRLTRESQGIGQFFRYAEQMIDDVDRSDLSTTEMAMRLYGELRELVGASRILDDALPLAKYIFARLKWRDEHLRTTIPLHANLTTHSSSIPTKTLKFAIRWSSTGPVDERVLKLHGISFVNYYRRNRSAYMPSSFSIADYSGVCAVHLLEQSLRREMPDSGITIYEIDIQEVPTPPPPPPEGTVIAPGIAILIADRPRHVYILGKSGTGKTTLMRNMARQDIEAGRGVGVIDPGDLVDNLIPLIPPERIKDVIYFNPAVTPLPLNFFAASSEMEKGVVADDILVLFKRLTDSWGERMGAMLRFTVRTLLEVPGTTFLDIYRLLSSTSYREGILQQVTNPVLLEYWHETFPRYPKDATHPITSRMSSYVLDPALTRIFGTRGNLSFFDVIQSGKILLVDIGKVGRETSPLLGSIFVSQLQLAVMRRAGLPQSERRPFYLYVDEFQNFTTSAFGEIFREARKYQLCLTVANQAIGDLDDTTRRAVSGAGTSFYFNPYQNEAKQLASFLDLEPRDLLTLKTYEGYLVTTGQPRKLMIDLPPQGRADNFDRIVESTKRLYLPDPAPVQEVSARDNDPVPGEWPGTGS